MKFEKSVKQTYECVKTGGLALIPTSVSYGLVGHSKESLEKKYRLKKRDLFNNCIIPANRRLLRKITLLTGGDLEIAEHLSEKYMLALICPINSFSPFFNNLDPFVLEHVIKKDNTAALYMNLGRFADKLVEIAEKDNFLLVGSSANISHTGNNYALEEVEEDIKKEVDFIYDGGLCVYHHPTGRPGSILDIRDISKTGNINFTRKGALYPEIYGGIKYFLNGKVEYPLDINTYLDNYEKNINHI